MLANWFQGELMQLRVNVMRSWLTPETLVTKKWDDCRWATLCETDGGGACTAMMYDRSNALLVEKPIVWYISQYENVWRNINVPKATLLLRIGE